MPPRRPASTRFPYTTLFRSGRRDRPDGADLAQLGLGALPVAGVEAAAGELEGALAADLGVGGAAGPAGAAQDRKSTRLNSSHANISYAVFCLKKKKQTKIAE